MRITANRVRGKTVSSLVSECLLLGPNDFDFNC